MVEIVFPRLRQRSCPAVKRATQAAFPDRRRLPCVLAPWQPESCERELPACILTRDLLVEFAHFRSLNIGFLPEVHIRTLASQIGHVHLQRRLGDGVVKLAVLETVVYEIDARGLVCI